MNPRLLAAGVLATATMAAAAAPASAEIVVGKSIGGVQVGSTFAQAKRAFGKPSAVQHGSTSLAVSWKKGQINATFYEHKLDGMIVRSSGQKTDKGIGVGSTRAQVKRAYPDAHYTQAMCEFISDHDSHDMSFNFRGDTVVSVTLS